MFRLFLHWRALGFSFFLQFSFSGLKMVSCSYGAEFDAGSFAHRLTVALQNRERGFFPGENDKVRGPGTVCAGAAV